jgi:hypothetical protein
LLQHLKTFFLKTYPHQKTRLGVSPKIFFTKFCSQKITNIKSEGAWG